MSEWQQDIEDDAKHLRDDIFEETEQLEEQLYNSRYYNAMKSGVACALVVGAMGWYNRDNDMREKTVLAAVCGSVGELVSDSLCGHKKPMAHEQFIAPAVASGLYLLGGSRFARVDTENTEALAIALATAFAA